MTSFLAPTKRKLAIAVAFFLVIPSALLFRAIPVSLNILDLRELGGILIQVICGWPIRIFDGLTGSAFSEKGSGGFLVFPSLVQIGGMIFLDFLGFYVLACAISYRRPVSPPDS